ncbi:hypothetical protein [Clostridium sp. CTA-6]|nr:hypothetical protein [Clostridium botulinum]EKS4395962.1 hypothetical protein [Clostridium botulinum]
MGLPSYILNWDELDPILKDYLENKIDVDIGSLSVDTSKIEELLEGIKGQIPEIDYTNLISSLNNLAKQLESLSNNIGISGTQKVYGKMLEIPAINKSYPIIFKASKKGKITGITYSLSTWHFLDTIDLSVVKDIESTSEVLFDNMRTKDFGENKVFNVFYNINKDDEIVFNFKNNSGTSKILWVDFNILEDN